MRSLLARLRQSVAATDDQTAPFAAALNGSPGDSPDAAADSGDALAAAVLFAIVGGFVLALAIVPAIGTITLGGLLGAAVGVVVAYQ